jgi:hypothetical protein
MLEIRVKLLKLGHLALLLDHFFRELAYFLNYYFSQQSLCTLNLFQTVFLKHLLELRELLGYASDKQIVGVVGNPENQVKTFL